jgi:hypothetical protein
MILETGDLPEHGEIAEIPVFRAESGRTRLALVGYLDYKGVP